MSPRFTAKTVQRITATLAATYPEAAPALVYSTPFELLVATVLSAQCTDKTVNRVTARLFKKYNTAEAFAALDPEVLAEEIKECGLYRNKSKHLVAAAQALLEQHGGIVPETRDELEQLPGVGKKTAGVVTGILYNSGALPVDTHVFRIAHRLGWSKAKTPHQVEEDLIRHIPPPERMQVHHRLLSHGRQTCRSRNPLCAACCFGNWLCQFPKQQARGEK